MVIVDFKYLERLIREEATKLRRLLPKNRWYLLCPYYDAEEGKLIASFEGQLAYKTLVTFECKKDSDFDTCAVVVEIEKGGRWLKLANKELKFINNRDIERVRHWLHSILKEITT